MLKDGSWSLWRIVVIAIVGAIISVGGWVFSEVRDLPATYETIEAHEFDTQARKKETEVAAEEIKKDLDTFNAEQNTRQQRIEEKIDETNRFLLDHFSRTP